MQVIKYEKNSPEVMVDVSSDLLMKYQPSSKRDTVALKEMNLLQQLLREMACVAEEPGYS